MAALSVILCRFLGFSPEGTPFRFELGFLPIALIGYLCGPIYAAGGYLVADIVGSFVNGYPPNIAISLCQMASGLLMGLFFHNKRISFVRVLLCFTAIGLLIDLLFKTPILAALYGWTFGATFIDRLINVAVNLPVRVTTFYFLGAALKKPMDKLLKSKKNASFASYANSFQAVTVPGLERISLLTKKLGSPEDALRFIHVAGTNGKGSVSAYMACILEEAGYKVGKFISPNLLRVNERISVNGADIPDGELEKILARIEPLCAEVERETGTAPTQFEIWTAAALVYFSEQRCEYVVLEVGLGGELDATNVIKKNELAIITRLGLDHTQYLGNTISDIARAKAGIIKADSTTRTVITVKQEDEALAVIAERCKALGITCEVVSPTPSGTEGVYERFSVGDMTELVCGIAGYHQIENASLAALAARRLGIDENTVKRGLTRAKNPARFELIREQPPVIYDGGHNENGIAALTASLKRYFGECKKTVIFACMADKEIEGSLKMLAEGGKTEFIYTTVKDNPRAMSAAALAEYAARIGFGGIAYENIGDAYEDAISRGTLVVICGSLYLYKDFREYLDK